MKPSLQGLGKEASVDDLLTPLVFLMLEERRLAKIPLVKTFLKPAVCQARGSRRESALALDMPWSGGEW